MVKEGDRNTAYQGYTLNLSDSPMELKNQVPLMLNYNVNNKANTRREGTWSFNVSDYMFFDRTKGDKSLLVKVKKILYIKDVKERTYFVLLVNNNGIDEYAIGLSNSGVSSVLYCTISYRKLRYDPTSIITGLTVCKYFLDQEVGLFWTAKKEGVCIFSIQLKSSNSISNNSAVIDDTFSATRPLLLFSLYDDTDASKTTVTSTTGTIDDWLYLAQYGVFPKFFAGGKNSGLIVEDPPIDILPNKFHYIFRDDDNAGDVYKNTFMLENVFYQLYTNLKKPTTNVQYNYTRKGYYLKDSVELNGIVFLLLTSLRQNKSFICYSDAPFSRKMTKTISFSGILNGLYSSGDKVFTFGSNSIYLLTATSNVSKEYELEVIAKNFGVKNQKLFCIAGDKIYVLTTFGFVIIMIKANEVVYAQTDQNISFDGDIENVYNLLEIKSLQYDKKNKSIKCIASTNDRFILDFIFDSYNGNFSDRLKGEIDIPTIIVEGVPQYIEVNKDIFYKYAKNKDMFILEYSIDNNKWGISFFPYHIKTICFNYQLSLASSLPTSLELLEQSEKITFSEKTKEAVSIISKKDIRSNFTLLTCQGDRLVASSYLLNSDDEKPFMISTIFTASEKGQISDTKNRSIEMSINFSAPIELSDSSLTDKRNYISSQFYSLSSGLSKGGVAPYSGNVLLTPLNIAQASIYDTANYNLKIVPKGTCINPCIGTHIKSTFILNMNYVILKSKMMYQR